jgi:hypothetical protein
MPKWLIIRPPLKGTAGIPAYHSAKVNGALIVSIFPPPEAARRLWLEFREPSALNGKLAGTKNNNADHHAPLRATFPAFHARRLR